MKRILPLMFIALFLASCASPHIGRSVNYDADSVCKINSYPASCSVTYDRMNISYLIEETENPDEYQISGTATYTGSGTWNSYSGAMFTLLVAQDGVVAEVFNIAGGRGSIDSQITFSRTFTFPGYIEAILLGYSMNVKG